MTTFLPCPPTRVQVKSFGNDSWTTHVPRHDPRRLGLHLSEFPVLLRLDGRDTLGTHRHKTLGGGKVLVPLLNNGKMSTPLPGYL